MSVRSLMSWICFIAGLLLIAAYWLWLRPKTGGLIGYTEDLGLIELPRQIMAENLREFGRPQFFTHRVMAPFGVNAALYPWAMERDWIGAWIWNHFPQFPWLWVYFGFSLTTAYVGVGFILGKMGLARPAAWLLALTFVLFHVPRHFKTYYHYEHLIQHWVYIAAFVDAWLWQKFWRQKTWSVPLEAWRAVLLVATMGLGGYYWGGMLLEWIIVRGFMIGIALRRRKRGECTLLERSALTLGLPLVIGVVWAIFALVWFIPLFQEYLKFGKVWQSHGWTAQFWMVFRPLWIDPLIPGFRRWLPIDRSETVVVLGWTLCLPVIFGVLSSRRRAGGPGLMSLAPFLLWAVLAVFYVHGGWLYFVQSYLRHLIPFMSYFRVASRMAVFFPIIAGTLIALAWPEMVRQFFVWSRVRRVAVGSVFAVMVALEIPILLTPVVQDQAISSQTQALLEKVRAMPGDQVLDLPFCVFGGNGICGEEQCTFFPAAITPALLTGLHGKKVYGVYESRLTEKQCEIYRKAPYISWFTAWRERRCLQGAEWLDFCSYLAVQPSLAAVLVYPGVWTAMAQPECRKALEEHLGPPLQEGTLMTQSAREFAERISTTSILLYPAYCR